MKRIYQTPETELVTISVEQMIAISGPVEDGFKTTDPVPTTDETSGNLSRRRDIWADEEEEEEQY